MEKTVARILIVLYIFFAGWTGSFVFGRYFTIANILLLPILVFLLYSWFKERYSVKQLFREDFFLLLLVLFVGVAALAHYNGHSLNYIVAYGFVFIAGFLLLKLFFLRYSTHKLLLNTLSIAVIFHSLFILVEFFSQTIFGIDIQEYMFKIFPHDAFYFGYPRCYGLTEEPTYVAHYLTTFVPLVFYHLHKTRLWIPVKIVIYTIVMVSFFLTFSTAGFAIAIIGAVLAVGLYTLTNISFLRKNWIWITLLLLVIFSMIFIVLTKDIPFIQPLLQKFSQTEVGLDGSRLNRWATDFPYLLSHPILGVGPGFFASQGLTSSVNWYLFLAIEAGLLSLFSLFVFLGFYLFRVIKIDSPYRFVYLYGFLNTFIYLFTCSTFYHPYPWLLLIMFAVCVREVKTI
ncbi:O-antigen ligase family protein [Williamwhitmania taraxaci]|uniref:O-Antigen ligase n=1 Tax=Williamwhitmania taraxaci TaxID=1640674 RepID=A0A1G6GLY6_9BACT|nr:O-antigen ligase family protein [Williamwhitmania taraxaci]SDB82944.1 O-Antigen ligase [Williamwhitmania taraxaci]